MMDATIPVRYPLVLWYCVSLHFVWAVMLLWDDAAGRITGMSDLHHWFGAALAPMLILIVAMALVPILYSLRALWPIVCLLPQQLILMVAAGTALYAMASSSFADGVTRPRAFIMADQAPAVLAAVFHTLAIIGNYWGSSWVRK